MSENQILQKGEVRNQVPQEVLLSVCIITYNHERYIRETLDSVLAQQTNFPFEICLGEDQSTDETRATCLEYAAKNPTKIRLFLRREEDKVFINGIKTGRYNCMNTHAACRGRYVAMCEGDDYWTDPLKLQKQVDVLEANASLSACVHRAQALVESGSTKEEIFPDVPESGQLTVLNALDHSKMFAATASLVFRNRIGIFPDWNVRCFMGDRIIFAALTAVGPIAVLPDVMSVYRRHDGGAVAKFLSNSGRLAGMLSRIIYFENIDSIVGRAPEIEDQRVKMLRHFIKEYAKICLAYGDWSFSIRVRGICGSFFRPSYLKTYFTHSGRLREVFDCFVFLRVAARAALKRRLKGLGLLPKDK